MFSVSLSHTPLIGTPLKNSRRMTATSSYKSFGAFRQDKWKDGHILDTQKLLKSFCVEKSQQFYICMKDTSYTCNPRFPIES